MAALSIISCSPNKNDYMIVRSVYASNNNIGKKYYVITNWDDYYTDSCFLPGDTIYFIKK